MANGSCEEDTTYHEQSTPKFRPRTVPARGVAPHAAQAHQRWLFGALPLGNPTLLAWDGHRLADLPSDSFGFDEAVGEIGAAAAARSRLGLPDEHEAEW